MGNRAHNSNAVKNGPKCKDGCHKSHTGKGKKCICPPKATVPPPPHPDDAKVNDFVKHYVSEQVEKDVPHIVEELMHEHIPDYVKEVIGGALGIHHETPTPCELGTHHKVTKITIGNSVAPVKINGSLEVTGSTTTISSTNTIIKDTLLSLQDGVTDGQAKASGLIINRPGATGTVKNAFIGYNETGGVFRMGLTSTTASDVGAGVAEFAKGTIEADLSGTAAVATNALACSGTAAAASKLSFVAVPVNSVSSGIQGQMAIDTNFLYICVGPSSWKRVGIANF